jgi:Flagellar motor component
MLLILGYLVVFCATMGGFMLAGGNPVVLLHISEFVTIIGIAVGVMIIASTKEVLFAIFRDILGCLKGGVVSKNGIIDLLKLLYELFMLTRKDGLIALDEHISEPQRSSIFSKYPSVLQQKQVMQFIVNAFRPLIDGRIKPEQMDKLLEAELDTIEDGDEQPVSILSLIGDSLPGIGIVAAVMGIINTMNAIAEGPERVGLKVAAALTGTFLGVWGAYGFVNPLAKRIQNNHRMQHMLLQIISTAISENVRGMAPLMAIEYARRKIDAGLQPDANELETLLKQTSKK